MVKSKFKITAILIIVLFVIPFISLQVQASEGSGTGTDGPAATTSISGGASYAKTGWLIYVMDENKKTLLSDVPFYYCHSNPPVEMIGVVETRFGDACTSNNGMMPDCLKEPFSDGNIENGKIIKEFLVTEQSDGECGAVQLMKEVWGVDFVMGLATDTNWILCLESVYWHNIFINGINTNIVFIGTARMEGEFQSKVSSLSPCGASPLGSMTNGIFATCAMVEPNAKLDIVYPQQISTPPRINNELMLAYGYGMIQAWPEDGDMIPTYNGKDSPGPPDDIPHGQANIVKSYHTITKTIDLGDKNCILFN